MCSNKWSRSLVQIKFSSVHSSLAHGPQLVSWLGGKVGQSRHRVVGITKSQVGAASGTEEEHRISYEELGRYGIDESDYADSMNQVADEHLQTSSSKAVKRQKRKAPYEVVDKTKDDPEFSEDMEFTDDAEIMEENDWCTYLILSNDKRKTYMGVTANLTRRSVREFHAYHLIESIVHH